MIDQTELRAHFALRLAGLYGTEVPLYDTLVAVAREVNQDHLAAHGARAERLGSIERVTAERHGAIRVGSPRELTQAARVFAGFGMHPVGFYDLRDASASSVPVVSTAFRPIERNELARNPFRVFTSMLVTDDRRFFDADLQRRLQAFLNSRILFPAELLQLADRAAVEYGLPERAGSRYLDLATAAFALSRTPIDHAWYRELERVSAVAADIGGVSSTHLNHLTPRVLDIDALYGRMRSRGIEMIDEIQGPPRWDGPDVLLRQTSFKALAERRRFRYPDGSVQPGTLRVRFGEVEQRGVALTAKGRELYDRMTAEVDARLAAAGGIRVDVARRVWSEQLPGTEKELARKDLAFFTYRVAGRTGNRTARLADLIEDGTLVPEPIVYEDFLPRSAAGIFQSNLTDAGTRDDDEVGVDYDLDKLAGAIEKQIHDPLQLYAAEQAESLAAAARQLQLELELTTIQGRPE